MWRKARLKPRTPVSEPDADGHREDDEEECAREPRAVPARRCGGGAPGELAARHWLTDQAVAQHDAAVGAFGERSARA